jgi:GTP-sensing pleiotropic transcriptional regulator CodY
MKEQYAGKLGYYGTSTDVERNKRMIEANKLVDEYNQNVFSYKTIEEQVKYQSDMVKKINKLI